MLSLASSSSVATNQLTDACIKVRKADNPLTFNRGSANEHDAWNPQCSSVDVSPFKIWGFAHLCLSILPCASGLLQFFPGKVARITAHAAVGADLFLVEMMGA